MDKIEQHIPELSEFKSALSELAQNTNHKQNINNFHQAVDKATIRATHHLQNFVGDEWGKEKENIINALVEKLKPKNHDVLSQPNKFTNEYIAEQGAELYNTFRNIFGIGKETSDGLVDLGITDGGLYSPEETDNIVSAIISGNYDLDPNDQKKIWESLQKKRPNYLALGAQTLLNPKNRLPKI